MADIEYELKEALSEIDRHHQNFAAISQIVTQYLSAYKRGEYILLDGVIALKAIQKIVG